MGQEGLAGTRGLTESCGAPEPDEIEVCLIGPGYGESVLVHIGDQKWVVVDSCRNLDNRPASLAYLDHLGVDPEESVCLIVVTHWHDDHIKGMSDLVEACPHADICCAAALCEDEFLVQLNALEGSEDTPRGRNMRELFNVMNQVIERGATITRATSNKLIHRQAGCEVWSLSPSDLTFQTFLRRMRILMPQRGQPKHHIPPLEPNDTSVVVLVEVGETAVLLGSDLEHAGWVAMLDDKNRVGRKASAFKIPHHGSEDAQVDRLWSEMLEDGPFTVLAPWRNGGNALPTKQGARRILSFVDKAYITAPPVPDAGRPARRRSRTVTRTIQETGARLYSRVPSSGLVRLRKQMGSSSEWSVEMFGEARELSEIL